MLRFLFRAVRGRQLLSIRSLLSSVLILLGVLLASCGLHSAQETVPLALQAPMNVDSGQRFHVSLGVENVGDRPFPGYQAFNGVMELRDETDVEVGCIQVATLWEIAPGEAAWPAAYASRLPPGAYRLTWGAPDYGSITVDFTIVELDGWLYLGKESIQSTAGTATVDKREYGPLQSLVDLARVNLAQRLGVEPEAVTVRSVEETAFADASLGVPEPDRHYAQVITPGYAIRLDADGRVYEYRASDERLVFVPREEGTPHGSITIEGVQVTAGEQIVVRGRSTLPDGTCLGSELWADGELQAWWPGHTCVAVEKGTWQMVVRLGEGKIPAELDRSAQYMLRAYQQGGPNIVAVFAFDLAGPPTAEP